MCDKKFVELYKRFTDAVMTPKRGKDVWMKEALIIVSVSDNLFNRLTS